MRADAPVHHVARRDDVGPGARVHERHLGEHLERRVVVDLDARRRAASAGCRSGRGRCTRRRTRRSSRRARARRSSSRRTARGTGPSGSRPLEPRASFVFGRPKRMTPPRPRCARVLRACSRASLDRELRDARHRRRSGAGASMRGVEEERPDEVARRERGLADERAERRGGAEAAGANGRKGHRVTGLE